jgi:hypothetical protein
VEFFPRYLAKKFGYFESISILKFALLYFGFALLSVIISSLLGERISNALAPLNGSILLIFFAGVVSAKHFARKAWIPTSPVLVQFTSKAWFNSLLSVLNLCYHWFVLLFVHALFVMVAFLLITSALEPFGS